MIDKEHELELALIHGALKRQMPDTVIIDTPKWFQIKTESSNNFWQNKVLRSRLSEAEADQKIKATILEYQRFARDFIWVQTAMSTPANLGELLRNNGFLHDHTGFGMVAEVSRPDIKPDEKIRVEQIEAKDAHLYAGVCGRGWSTRNFDKDSLARELEEAMANPTQKTRYFIAYYEGIPAATGGLLPFESSGYLLGSSVVPEFRGKGVYRALVRHRLELLKSMNIQYATIFAMAETSAPICKKLGFEIVCENHVFKKYFDR